MRVFVPCPDRRSREVYERMAPLLVEAAEPYASTCCGLGFGIPQRDPDRSRAMAERACADAHADEVCTYCASCSGALGRIGSVRVRHALTIILGTNEDPDIAHSLANRARAAVRRRPFA